MGIAHHGVAGRDPSGVHSRAVRSDMRVSEVDKVDRTFLKKRVDHGPKGAITPEILSEYP